MKYSVNAYAKALAEAALDGKAHAPEVIKNFLALVRKNGDEAHMRSIIAAAERFMWKKSALRKVTVESARKLKQPVHALFREIIGSNDVVEERINAALVAGVRITINEEMQLDGSLRGTLDKLFSIS